MDRILNRKIMSRSAFILVLAMLLTAVPHIGAFAAKKTNAKGVVTATELYMRSGPGTEYKNICRGDEKVLLVKDQEVTVLGKRNGWYHIKAEFKSEEFEGYSLGDYISITSGTVEDESGEFKEITPTPTPTPTPAPSGKGIVTASELFVRKGPGTDYDNILIDDEKAILVMNQEVTLYGETNGWYHLSAKINGKTVSGYSLGTYIQILSGTVGPEETPTPEEPTPSAAVPTPDEPTPTLEPTNGPDQPVITPDPDEPEDTPIPTAGVQLPEGAVVSEDGTVYDAEGNELEIVTDIFASKYDLKGTVTVSLLNIRRSASLSADVLGIISEGTVVYLVGSAANKIQKDGKEVSARWYRIIALVDNVPVRGYVLSDYIKLDYNDGFVVTTKYSKQSLRKSAGSSKKITTSKGKTVKLPKKSEVEIISEKDVNGTKWVKVRAEYKDETVTGWMPALRVYLDTNAESISVSYYAVKEKPADVIVTEAPTPTPEPDNKDNIADANAVIKDAAALSLKTEPKYASAAVFTDDKIPVMVYSGQGVRLIDTTSDSDNVWCRIEVKFNEKTYTGYVNAIYVQAESGVVIPTDPTGYTSASVDFEEGLNKEGFPESYKPFLRELHMQYPNWIFKAYNTGLDWDTVIAKESVVGENLIPNTKSVEWKSLEAGAYSFKSDSFTVFDGSSWVTASKEAISYYMDPRNFLGHDTIFQFELLNYNPSFQTKEGVAVILKNTAMNGASFEYTDELGQVRSISYADTFLMAAEYSGVSPIHLASRVKQEVTIGSSAMSNSVTGTVSGLESLYNFFNIGAYHSTEPGGAIANGLRFARDGSASSDLNMKCLIPWNNRFRSILGGAFYIGNNYINRGQNTIYLQKFNVTENSTFNHQYMANVEAPYSEGKRMFAAYENPEDIPIVFMIPVYLNMPENPCPVPAKAYNPNNWLKSLKLYDIKGEALTLSPQFSITADQEYTLVVDYETDYIKVSANTVSALAKVLGDEYIYPSVGTNRLVIPIQAENGDIREYVVNIIRKEQEITPTPTPEPTPEPTPVPTEPVEPTDTPTPTEEPTPTPTEPIEPSQAPEPSEEPSSVPSETPSTDEQDEPTPSQEESSGKHTKKPIG